MNKPVYTPKNAARRVLAQAWETMQAPCTPEFAHNHTRAPFPVANLPAPVLMMDKNSITTTVSQILTKKRADSSIRQP